jgi:hypothetical protein
MARNVITKFRQFLPGAGRDANGNPVQGKTKVTGDVVVTSYVQQGEDLSPRDVGLTTIDSLTLRVVGEAKNNDGLSTRQAIYSDTTSQFYLIQTNQAEASTIAQKLAAGATETVQFVAEGDSAHNVELL